MKTLTNGSFQSPAGVVVANGKLILTISQDAEIIAGGQVKQGLPAVINLDANGDVAGTPQVYGQEELSPGGTFYYADILDSNGNRIRETEKWVITGASPINLDLMVPTLVNPDPAFSNPVLQNPSASQTITGQSLTIASSAPFLLAGSTSGTTKLQASAVASGTVTVPAATDTLVGKATTDTLTNKTLTSPVITTAPSPTLSGAVALNGPSYIVYNTTSASTNASIGATTMATAGGSGNTYRFTAYADITEVGIGCTGTTSVGVAITFNDPEAGSTSSDSPVAALNQSTAAAGATGSIAVSGNGTLGTFFTIFPRIYRAKASTIIQYQTTYNIGADCTTGPKYRIYPILELLV